MKIDDNAYLTQWKQEYQDKVNREKREADFKQTLNEETAISLSNQIKEKEAQQEQDRLKQQQIARNRLVQLSKDKEQLAIEQEKKLEFLLQKQIECRQEYEEFKQRREREALKEKQEDKEFIESVLRKEKLEDEKAAQKQKGLKNDINSYVQYLKDLKQEEANREKQLDILRAQELDKAWQKRELQWQKEKLARKQLLRQVYEERNDQVVLKSKLNEKNDKKDESEANRLVQTLQDEINKENEKQQERLRYNKEIQNFLKQQIQEKNDSKKAERNEGLVYSVSVQKEQDNYQAMIKEEAHKDEMVLRQGKTVHHYPKTSANWWTL